MATTNKKQDEGVPLFGKEVGSVYHVERDLMPITVADTSNLKNDNTSLQLFLTGFDGGTNVNYQLNYAFNNDVYAYIFGERLSVINIQGLAFAGACEGAATTTKYSPQEFINFYNKYKLKLESNGDPLKSVTFTVSNMTFVGYFIALKVNLVYERENFFNFSLAMLGRVTT